MSEPVIAATGLRKTYRGTRGEVEAVRGVDLAVARGEVFGVLGPNGAGKSTTLGMLTTLVAPTAGTATVAGFDVVRRAGEVRRRIGVVAQRNTLDRKLTAAENLEFRGRYFGMTGRVARRRAADLLDVLELGHRRDALVHELSGGQVRRLMVGRALVHRPEVLFLDEPTAGVDPQARANLWDLVTALNAGGLTVVLTTHHLEEAERLCERLLIVDHGRVLSCDRLPGLVALAGAASTVDVRFDGPAPALADLAGEPGVRRLEVDGDSVRVTADAAERILGVIINRGAAAGRTVRDANLARPSLEHVFLSLTGREYRG